MQEEGGSQWKSPRTAAEFLLLSHFRDCAFGISDASVSRAAIRTIRTFNVLRVQGEHIFLALETVLLLEKVIKHGTWLKGTIG